ncbi:cell division protein FtsL [bacterium]|nr:cell division protein FtsL [bacterium]
MAAGARALLLRDGDAIAPGRRAVARLARKAPPTAPVARTSQRAFPFAVGAPAMPRVRPLDPLPALPVAARRTVGAEIGREDRRRALRSNIVAGLVLLVVGAVHVWTGIEAVRVGYALGAARQMTVKLDQEVHELKVELAAATAPARIEQVAAKLGLHAPAPGQVVVP